MKSALILFAHGSRDPEWVRPFETLRQSIAAAVGAATAEAASGGPAAGATAIELAYLESSQPSLDGCIRSLAERGVATVRVLPLFLAMGKHLRNDIPALAGKVAADFPGMKIEFLPALGEAPEFVDALSRIALRSAQQP